MRFVLASQNAHKLSEISAVLAEFGDEVVSAHDVGIDLDVEETGTTFEENSRIKAQAILDRCGMPTIADDSGLMVDALDGAPGVYSHRFGNKDSDHERCLYLLERLQDVPFEKRTARFVSVVTCLFPTGGGIVARGTCEGVILSELRGDNGFGYDPLFFVPEFGKTFAELSAAQKNTISHRGNALRSFREQYREWIGHADK